MYAEQSAVVAGGVPREVTRYPPVRVADLPPAPASCFACTIDVGTCTCTEQCRAIVCGRGPWDDEKPLKS